MTYQMTFNAELEIIEVNLSGNISVLDVREIVNEGVILSKQTNCRSILGDFRQVTLRMDLMDIHDLPKLVASLVGSGLAGFKRAVVVQHESEYYKYAENIFRNRYHDMRIFTDMDEARNWLAPNKAMAAKP